MDEGVPLRRHRRLRWDCDYATIALSQLPSTLVEETMVAPAEEQHVPQLRGSTIGPVFYMVAVGPGRRHIAPWETAVFVARGQRPLHRRGYHPAAAGDLDPGCLSPPPKWGDPSVACR